MSDELTILASAYLDGDVTAGERAQVESSDELLREVDRLRGVRAVMSNAASADPAPISARERHLSSALDAWDRLPDNERTGALRDSTPTGADAAAAAGVAAMSSPPRRRAKRRRGQSPAWLGAAAAGLVLVLAGGLVLRNTVNDEDEDSSSADATVESIGGSSGDADLQSRAPEAGAAEAPAPVADASTGSDAAAQEAPADTVSNEIVLGAEAPPADDGELQLLTSEDDLVIFASDAAGAPDSAELPAGATVITDAPSDEQDTSAAAELPLCQDADVVVGLAIYIDEQVVVGIDLSRNRAVAYREADCSLVARASMS